MPKVEIHKVKKSNQLDHSLEAILKLWSFARIFHNCPW